MLSRALGRARLIALRAPRETVRLRDNGIERLLLELRLEPTE